MVVPTAGGVGRVTLVYLPVGVFAVFVSGLWSVLCFFAVLVVFFMSVGATHGTDLCPAINWAWRWDTGQCQRLRTYSVGWVGASVLRDVFELGYRAGLLLRVCFLSVVVSVPLAVLFSFFLFSRSV